MKKSIALLAVLFLVALASSLNAQGSTLIVFNELREDFFLVINGQRVNANPAQHIRVTDLQPSEYRVEAIFSNPTQPKQVMTLYVQPNRQISYALVRAEGRGPMLFSFLSEYSMGYIPVAPQAVVSVAYTGPLMPPASVPVVQPDPTPAPTPVPVPTPGPVVIVQPAPTPVPVEPVRPDPLPGYTGPIGCPYPMDPGQFADAKRSIASKSFSDTKMQIAKQITRGNCLLTSQVLDIMALFSFESQKLEFAKFAYPFTYDQGNYYRVNDGFGFESSIRDLEEYLNGLK